MGLTTAILLILGGVVPLIGGGELLVRNAVSMSRLLRVSPAVIGLTIVAAATSLPELAVSLMATIKGSHDVAVGNVVGSNIFNLAAILGITAFLFPPLQFREKMIRVDVSVMIAAGIGAFIVARDHMITRTEGAAFVLLLIAFLTYRTRRARADDPPPGHGTASEIEEELQAHTLNRGGALTMLVLILVGAGLLAVGADLLVRGATGLARIAGVSERVIAITLVSAGTGLPELVTAIMAGLRRHSAVAVGNVIGSNIFNVLGIMGIVSLVKPVAVSQRLATVDMYWMLGFSLAVLVPVVFRKRSISRSEGVIAIAAYVVYILTLLRS